MLGDGAAGLESLLHETNWNTTSSRIVMIPAIILFWAFISTPLEESNWDTVLHVWCCHGLFLTVRGMIASGLLLGSWVSLSSLEVALRIER